MADYLCQPHSVLGRDGPVCPFVPAALKGGSVLVAERHFQDDIDADEMTAAVFDMMEAFDGADWPPRGESVRALVWVLTGISEERFHLLDSAHRATKSDVVERGFILGQFHPACPEGAIRNPHFMVSRAPLPMFGLRRMAIHDVLFLHSDPAWFSAYQERFGDLYESGGVVNRELVSIYRQACHRWNG